LRDRRRDGKKIASNPEILTAYKGVTYLFSNAEAKAICDKDPDGIAAKADGKWASLR
jgi:YHS domain-containing protein